ncbi:MAG TPA: DUF3159 domain-containing protein [Actinobacteria bacterium]|nr:DUF3159 domain-containing protein [Actinomycetota bacterium]
MSHEEADPSPQHETPADLRAESILLERAIGGWRGIIDSGLPTVVFVVGYLVTSENLGASLAAALLAAGVIVGWRLLRHESLQQIAAGFAGVLISAGFAKYTGKAENFYALGLLTNLAYGLAFLVSILVSWPLIGVFLGFFTGKGTSWRKDLTQRRVLAAASWIWVGVFFGRLIVQAPLYWSESVTTLGIVKVVMGWPLFLGAAYFTYRLLGPTYRAMRATPN